MRWVELIQLLYVSYMHNEEHTRSHHTQSSVRAIRRTNTEVCLWIHHLNKITIVFEWVIVSPDTILVRNSLPHTDFPLWKVIMPSKCYNLHTFTVEAS